MDTKFFWKHRYMYFVLGLIKHDTVMILSFRTDMPGQTV